MVGYKLSKNDWVTPFFVIFRSVREILLVTVFCKHPVTCVFTCVCVCVRDFGDIVCQIAHDMTTCGWSDVLKRRRRRRRLQLINNHADSLMAARCGRYLLLTREYGKSWVSTRYRAQCTLSVTEPCSTCTDQLPMTEADTPPPRS